ncbi:hypothetical protein BHE74_00041243 [Ensete ventricosum]|nr:hypothetical protein GW17_00042572 [Ensete ventricosum]RWW52349.1 hypothetical protein BHE74_00041243 [Ensete ventricosum]RZS09166.1 hypothetical protein BHM03_00040224 [Ensete ventricosum]
MLNSGLYLVATCLELQCGFLSRVAEGAAAARVWYVSVASNVLVFPEQLIDDAAAAAAAGSC